VSARTIVVATAVLDRLIEFSSKTKTSIPVGKACEGITGVIDVCGPHSLAIVANK